MKINYRISDFIFIGILGLLIASAIVQSVIFGYLVTINNYLGFAGWVTVLVLMFTRFVQRLIASNQCCLRKSLKRTLAT